MGRFFLLHRTGHYRSQRSPDIVYSRHRRPLSEAVIEFSTAQSPALDLRLRCDSRTFPEDSRHINKRKDLSHWTQPSAAPAAKMSPGQRQFSPGVSSPYGEDSPGGCRFQGRQFEVSAAPRGSKDGSADLEPLVHPADFHRSAFCRARRIATTYSHSDRQSGDFVACGYHSGVCRVPQTEAHIGLLAVDQNWPCPNSQLRVSQLALGKRSDWLARHTPNAYHFRE